jgi:hypothetical protein
MMKFFVKIFIFTRLIYLFIIFYSNLIAENYDLSNRLVSENFEEKGYIETFITKFISYFYTYDSVHFTHIAKKWYTNDKNFAFFPLYPIMVNYVAIGLSFILSLFGLKYTEMTFLYVLAGFLISNALCFANTVLLEK